MSKDEISTVLSGDKFKLDLLTYLDIDKKQSIDITINYEKENNNTYRIFVATEKKNYLVYAGFSDMVYEFIEFEDLDTVIENEKFNFDIDYWSYNITYDQLARLYDSGKIIIPDMQRGFVWDDLQASRLIESILMGLPLPSLFLIKNIEEGNYLIVDGLQRLTSIHAFRYNKKLPNRSSNISGFSLKGVNKAIRNKTYDELFLEGKTDKFDMGTINVIEFKQNKPDHEEAMYTLFERLNGGGTNLSAQQIRNSIYYGTFNDLLNDYSALIDKYFSKKAILALAPSETLLRIIAVYNYINKEYSSMIESKYENFESLTSNILYKKLYNETAKFYHMRHKIVDRQNNEEQSKEYKEELTDCFEKIKNAINLCETIFDSNTFKRYDVKKGDFLNRFTPILFESLIITILLNESNKLKDKEKIIQDFKTLFKPESEFDKFFSQGTGRLKNIFGRINSLEQVLYENSRV